MEDEFCVFNCPNDQPEASSHAYFHKVKISK